MKNFPPSLTNDVNNNNNNNNNNNSNNNNNIKPHVVIHSIACGGAHTLALLYHKVEKGLAFPFGVQTHLLAWGYGSNGQLGKRGM